LLDGLTTRDAVAAIASKPISMEENLDWLKDVSRAARHLTRLMLESSAQAALITRDNELWAYAGQLSREAAQELAHSVQKYWDTQSRNDILRFIRLEATEAQHMLYAKQMTPNMVLALVFDAETPFSTIRNQAGQLMKSLSQVSPEQTSQVNLKAVVEELVDEEDAAEDEELPPFSELLGDVPPPIPPKTEAKIGPNRVVLPWEVPAAPLPLESKPVETESKPVAQAPAISPVFSRESSPAVPVSALRSPLSSLEVTRLSRSRRAAETQTDTEESPLEDLAATRVQKPKSDPQSIVETKPQSVTEVAHRIVLEPASAAMYNLNYACLLVPRFEHHHLTGDLAERLTEWVPQACVAFGWRLEHMAVRPEYLQWVLSVLPSTAPGYIMRIIRQQTSERIFVEFPRLKNENASGDFWAPGYLIMGGSAPHPQKLVRDFIKQTRSRQGLHREEE
jgi:REP element-mobilizing transposase RayT